jgi:hypothetical protein
MARQIASAVYCESLAPRNDEMLETQAQALAIKANEVALEQMLQAMNKAATAYQQVYSLG